jgi:hypothetical protein
MVWSLSQRDVVFGLVSLSQGGGGVVFGLTEGVVFGLVASPRMELDALLPVMKAIASSPKPNDGFMSYTSIVFCGSVFRYNGDTLVIIASDTVEQDMPNLIPKMKLVGYGNGSRIFTMSLPIETVRKKFFTA